MSWNVTGSSLTPDSIRRIAAPPFANAPDESNEQFDYAVDLAAELAESGVLGDPENEVFNVSLSGHANDGHVKNTQWTNDWVTINVSQA